MKNRSVSYLVVLSLLVLANCSSKTDSPTEQIISQAPTEETYELTKTQFVSSNMKLGKMEMASFHDVVKSIGMFDVPPENRVSVSSYFEGTVKDIRLLPGEKIKKGQLLFVLENPDFVQIQQDYLEAKSQLAYLKSDFERQKNLFQDNVSSQKSFLKAEADYTVTRVKVESLSKKLSLMNINPTSLTLNNIRTTINITSPIDGYVTHVDITRGSFINPTQSAVTIVDPDHLHLELNIYEKDLANVSVGQPITFRVQENNDEEYKAFVHLVNKTIDSESRTIDIHGHLADESLASKFTPGMYVEADIYSSSESKLALPQSALVEVEGKYYVLILKSSSDKGYSFVKKEVKIGDSNNDFAEILNSPDFKSDAVFLTKGAFNIITE